MNLISYSEKILHRFLGNELDVDLKSYLVKGTFYSLLIQFFAMVLNFFSGILLARLLGADGYGIFTLVFTWLSVFCTIAVFGTDDLLVREIANFKNDFSGITKILSWATVRVLLFSLTISLICVSVFSFADIVSEEKKLFFNFLLFAIPVYSLLVIFQSAQRGLHNVIAGQFPEKIIRPFFLIFFVSCLYFFTDKISSLSAVLINIAAYFLALLFLIFPMKKYFSSVFTLQKNSLWFRSSFYFFISTIMAIINVRADIIMLGWMRTDADVGIYNVAARFSDFTAFALLLITPIIAPSISRLHSLNDKVKLRKLIVKSAAINFIFALVVSVILLLSGNFLLRLFGNEFTGGYSCMVMLCAGQLITTFFGPAGNILLMTGFEKLAFYSGLTGTMLNIVLNYFLIPQYGINGAAFATACSLFVWNGLQTFFVFKKLGINSMVVKF